MFLVKSIDGSIGDRSQFYSLCLEKCHNDNCDNGTYFQYFIREKLSDIVNCDKSLKKL